MNASPQHETQQPLPLPMMRRSGFENKQFLVCNANRAAYNAVYNWCSDEPNRWRIFSVAGAEKCGKSHLGEIWRAKNHAQPLTLQLLEAEETPRHSENKFWLDIAQQDWPLPAESERALYTLYNRITETEGALLITARPPPARWRITLPDLRSRMRAVACQVIQEPDDSDMHLMLEKIFETRQLRIKSDVLASYLSNRLERSFRALHDIAERLDHASLVRARPITRALAREILLSLPSLPSLPCPDEAEDRAT